MPEKIYLRVPSKIAFSSIEQGNFRVELTPKGVVTVTNRRFADWLVREHALAEIDKPGDVRRKKRKSRIAEPADDPGQPAELNEPTDHGQVAEFNAGGEE